MALTKYIADQILPLITGEIDLDMLTEIVRNTIEDDLKIWQQMQSGILEFRDAINDKSREIKDWHKWIEKKTETKSINMAKALIIRAEREKYWLQTLRDDGRSREKIIKDGIAWLTANLKG